MYKGRLCLSERRGRGKKQTVYGGILSFCHQTLVCIEICRPWRSCFRDREAERAQDGTGGQEDEVGQLPHHELKVKGKKRVEVSIFSDYLRLLCPIRLD